MQSSYHRQVGKREGKRCGALPIPVTKDNNTNPVPQASPVPDRRFPEAQGLMDSHDLLRLFEAVRRGDTTPDEASRQVRTAPLEEAGAFAHVDLQRSLRCGSAEVIFGQGKTTEQIIAILGVLLRHGNGGLVTRINAEVGAALTESFPAGVYHAAARCFRIKSDQDPGPKLGRVVVCDGREPPTSPSPRKHASPPKPGTARSR